MDAHGTTTMIRQETIFSKLNLIKVSDLVLLQAMQVVYSVCPSCGAVDSCEPYSDYTRWMIYIYDGERTEVRVIVDRVKDGSCGHTHALIADILIPYSSYSLRFILHVLRSYTYRNCNVAVLCERYSIAISTLYRWIHLFKEHANLWLTVLEQIIRMTTEALDCFEDIHQLPSVFFKRYRFSFLQSRETARCRHST